MLLRFIKQLDEIDLDGQIAQLKAIIEMKQRDNVTPNNAVNLKLDDNQLDQERTTELQSKTNKSHTNIINANLAL